ncbi:MFS monocarboxylate transporter [Ilyonectria robusta]
MRYTSSWVTTISFAPISLMRDGREEHDFFGPQRKMSLFRRVEKSGQMSATLRVNHRAHGTVVNWAGNYFHNSEMQVFNKAPSSLTMSMRKWLAAVSGVQKPTSAVYVFDVDESTEIGVGTSFANPVNALFGRELVAHIYRNSPIRKVVCFATGRQPVRFGSLLLIVGYSAQNNEWADVFASSHLLKFH